jgi:glutaredoxin 3
MFAVIEKVRLGHKNRNANRWGGTEWRFRFTALLYHAFAFVLITKVLINCNSWEVHGMAEPDSLPVVLYVMPTSPDCRRARDFLIRRGIEFTIHDVSQDPDALREMMWRSGQRDVPVIVVGDEVIVGFDLERLNALLPRAERPRARLGVSIATAKPAGKRPMGAYVGNVAADMPAERAGVQQGDIIVEMAQRPVRDASDVHAVLSTLLPGTRVALTVWRMGHEFRLVVRV